MHINRIELLKTTSETVWFFVAQNTEADMHEYFFNVIFKDQGGVQTDDSV